MSGAAAQVGHVLLVVWALVVCFSTAAAEVLLGLTVVVALVARRAVPSAGCWPRGWSSLLVGGPMTRWIPGLWLAFLAWYFVSIALGRDPAEGLSSAPKLVRYAMFFLPLALPWGESGWRLAFRAQLLLTVVLLVLSLLALSGGTHRASTEGLHYNTLGHLAAMCSLLLLAASLYGPPSQRPERWVLLLGSLAAGAVMVLTLSRAAVLAWWIGVIVLVLMRVPRSVALGALVLLIVVPALAVPVMQSRRADLFDLDHPEFTRRYDMWTMARGILSDHPVSGVGPGGLGVVYDDYRTGALVEDERRWIGSHNDVLTVGIRHGLVGAALWVAITLTGLVAFLRRLWRFDATRGSWVEAGFAGAGASLLLFALFGLVHDNYIIYLKMNLLLFLWGIFVAADRRLGAPGTR